MCPNRIAGDQPRDEASLNGKAAFALAAFVAGMALVALLDRLGAPEALVAPLTPALALSGLAVLGFLSRTMRASHFFAGGRMTPPLYVGGALLGLFAGVGMPFVGLTPGGAAAGAGEGAVLGAGLGLIGAGLVCGPGLRRTEALSVGDCIARRFPNIVARLLAIAVLASVAMFVALAGLEGAARTLGTISRLSRPQTLMVVTGAALMLTLPGGAAGVIWGAVAGAAILLVALALPLALAGKQSAAGLAQFFPEQGSGWAAHGAELLSLAPTHASGWAIAATLALGLTVLPALMLAPMGAKSARGARRGGVAGLGLILAVIALGAVAAAASRLLFAPGASPGAADLLARFAADHALGVAFQALSATAIMVAMLVLASAGLQGLAGSLAHDGLFRLRDRGALTSRRLAFARLALIAGALASAWLLNSFPLDPAMLIGLAIALSAALLFPILALVSWSRARSGDAVMALLTGLAAAAAGLHVLALWPPPERLAGAAALAGLAGLAAGLATSLLRVGPAGEPGAALPDIDRAA